MQSRNVLFYNVAMKTFTLLFLANVCSVAADVGFILDSSYSLRYKYKEEKYFLKSLAASFDLTNRDVKASVVTFSSFPELSIKFNEHDKTDTFNAAIDRIPLMGFLTRIDLALRLTQSKMFTPENGARENYPKVLVLITDGAQTKPRGRPYEDPALVANELRKSGVYFVVVGIGDQVVYDELISIAGDEKRVFTSTSFDELVTKDFIKKVSLVTCPSKLLYLRIDSLL